MSRVYAFKKNGERAEYLPFCLVDGLHQRVATPFTEGEDETTRTESRDEFGQTFRAVDNSVRIGLRDVLRDVLGDGFGVSEGANVNDERIASDPPPRGLDQFLRNVVPLEDAVEMRVPSGTVLGELDFENGTATDYRLPPEDIAS